MQQLVYFERPWRHTSNHLHW